MPELLQSSVTTSLHLANVAALGFWYKLCRYHPLLGSTSELVSQSTAVRHVQTIRKVTLIRKDFKMITLEISTERSNSSSMDTQ